MPHAIIVLVAAMLVLASVRRAPPTAVWRVTPVSIPYAGRHPLPQRFTCLPTCARTSACAGPA
jgi:hypothetical protein